MIAAFMELHVYQHVAILLFTHTPWNRQNCVRPVRPGQATLVGPSHRDPMKGTYIVIIITGLCREGDPARVVD